MKKVQFTIDPAAQINIDPQIVGESLEDICKAHGGKLVREDVVSAAERKRNPLHKYFVWDDSEAARFYRLDQASRLISAVKVVLIPGKKLTVPIRYFINVKKPGERSYYVDVVSIKDNGEAQIRVLQKALKELQNWMKRYHMLVDEYEELQGLFSEIEKTERIKICV